MTGTEEVKRDRWGGLWGRLLIFAILFMLAAVLYPMFFYHEVCKGKSSEAQETLSSIYKAQRKFYQENGFFAGGPRTFRLLDQWQQDPERQYLYAFYCGNDFWPNSKGPEVPRAVAWPKHLLPASSRTGFTCAAVGNIDADPDLDYWFINDAKELVNAPSDVR